MNLRHMIQISKWVPRIDKLSAINNLFLKDIYLHVLRNRRIRSIKFLCYCQTSNMSPTLAGNKIVYHSDVDGATFLIELTHRFNWLDKRQLQGDTRNIQAFGFDIYILDIWRY